MSKTPSAASTTKTPAPKKRAPARRKGAAAAPPVRLGEAEIAAAQSSARHWARQDRFALNEYFVHPKFGVGLVTEVTEQGYIVCLFADGDTRKLIHASPA